MIEFKNVAKSFGRQKVLHELNLQLNTPQLYALLGPNGSGKTTLVKSLMGMVRPDAGEIHFEGQALEGVAYRRQIAYLPQIARFPENLRVTEFFALLEKLRGPAERKAELRDLLGIAAFEHKSLRSLSGGMRQKVNLMSALMYDTPVILLDEPTSGLDPVALLKLKEWLRKEKQAGKYIVLTTHILELVEEIAEQIVFMLEGRIYFQGSPQELFRQTETQGVEMAIATLLTQNNAA